MLPFIIVLVITILKILHFIYLFQIKEYRFDRFISHAKQEGWANLFYLSTIHMPAKKGRNVLIFILSLLILNYFLRIIFLNSNILIIIFIFYPFVLWGAISLAVAITQIPVKIYRDEKIRQAKEKVAASKTVFIGITGSYGKTSVKEFLYHILSKKFRVAKTDKNHNTDIGVALSVLKNLKDDTEYFIAEAGAYRIGEIKNICDIVNPKYGILTSLGNQHLDLFGSKENQITAKGELIDSLPEDGIAFINQDIPEVEQFTKKMKGKVILFSPSQKQDFDLETHLYGQHNITNLLPCIALAKELGMSNVEIQEAIKELKPIEGKLSLHDGPNCSKVLNDSANSNVEGFIAAIQTANQFPQKTKILISKGIIELGVEKRSSYERILKELYKTNITLYTTDKLFKELDTEKRVNTLNDVMEIVPTLIEQANSDTLFVLEGKFPEQFLQKLLT